MADAENKQRSRFKKLRELVETVEKQETEKIKKASVCDEMLKIYKNKELDISQKSELFCKVLSGISEQ